jgi:hypothetical protein
MSDVKKLKGDELSSSRRLHVVADAASKASQAAEKQWPEWGYLYHHGAATIRVEYVAEAKQYPHEPTTWLLLR